MAASTSSGRGRLDILAQSGTTRNLSWPAKIIRGKGSDLGNKAQIRGRGKRKIITQSMALSLVKVARRKGDAEFEDVLWNTYHCQNKIYSVGDRLHGEYCKNRFCIVCLANRKADIINRYYPVLKDWPEPHFVTLTVKSVKANKLNYWLESGMIRGFRLIVQKLRKRHQRGKGIKIMGVKSLECCFNPAQKTYNPHFHLIVPTKTTGDLLIEEWLRLWTPKHAARWCQNIRRVGCLERDLVETIKYGSKIFTPQQVNKKARQKGVHRMYVAALYNILKAMKGHRLFDRFGFDLPKTKREPFSFLSSEHKEWEYESKLSVWINPTTGEPLFNYLPSSDLLTLLIEGVDVDLE